jgi:hypothetical protein
MADRRIRGIRLRVDGGERVGDLRRVDGGERVRHAVSVDGGEQTGRRAGNPRRVDGRTVHQKVCERLQ